MATAKIAQKKIAQPAIVSVGNHPGTFFLFRVIQVFRRALSVRLFGERENEAIRQTPKIIDA
jgi:hypothetical protein